MVTRFTEQETRKVNDGTNFVDKANIEYGQVMSPGLIREVTIDLTTARTITNALVVGFKFDCIHVVSVNNDAGVVNAQFFTAEENQSSVPMSNKDVLNFSKTMAKAFFTNEAQPGIVISIRFYIGMHFESGSNVIDLKSQANAFNVAGLTLQNNDLNCVLSCLLDATPVPAGSDSARAMNCRNNPQYNVTGQGFVVPANFEFVITGMSKINRRALASAIVDKTFLGAAKVAPGFVAGVYVTADPLYLKKFYNDCTLTEDYYDYPLTAVDDVAANFPINQFDASNTALECIVTAGSSVAAFISNEIGSATLVNMTVQVFVVGFLRKVA